MGGGGGGGGGRRWGVGKKKILVPTFCVALLYTDKYIRVMFIFSFRAARKSSNSYTARGVRSRDR